MEMKWMKRMMMWMQALLLQPVRLPEGLKEIMGQSWSLVGEAVSVVQIRISEHLIPLALSTPETKGNNKVSVRFYCK